MPATGAKPRRRSPERNRQTVQSPANQSLNTATSANNKASPVSDRPKLGQRRIREPFPFLDLPGEIRNRIYDLAVTDSRVAVSTNHPQKELQALRKAQPHIKHKAPLHHLYGMSSERASGRALLFVSPQVNKEVLEYVYARTSFHFDRMVVLRAFLKTAPRAAIASVQSLDLKHIGYGEPERLADREWKLRCDKRWADTLREVRQEMPALRTLSLDVTLFDWPVQLRLGEAWSRPYLEFSGEHALARVNFTMEQDAFDSVKVAATARELENRMMTPQGRKQKRKEERVQEAENKKREQEAKRKTKVLVVTVPNGYSSVFPAKKVVKNKRLEQYSVAPPQAGLWC